MSIKIYERESDPGVCLTSGDLASIAGCSHSAMCIRLKRMSPDEAVKFKHVPGLTNKEHFKKRMRSALKAIGWEYSGDENAHFNDMLIHFRRDLKLTYNSIAGFTGYSNVRIRYKCEQLGINISGRKPRRGRKYVLATGESGSLEALAELFDVNFNTVKTRLRRGFSIDDALKVPIAEHTSCKQLEKQESEAEPVKQKTVVTRTMPFVYPKFYEPPPSKKIRARWLLERWNNRKSMERTDMAIANRPRLKSR